MDRRAFLGALTGAFAAAPLAANAQPAVKVRRIGYLFSGALLGTAPLIEALRQGLRELGWVDGQNIVIEYRFAEGQFDRLPALVAELVRLSVDIIVAAPTPAAVAARNATGMIPIVIINVGDPVGLGLIASLARPGGNVTGISWSVGLELLSKQLELLKEVVPAARRVAILSNPANPSHALLISNVKIAAQSLGVQLQILEARDPNEFEVAFAAMVKERVGALVVVSDSMFGLHRARLAELEAKNRLPSMHGTRANVKAGGLLYYGPNFLDQWRHAATFVDKILKGATPGDIPVEQPTKFELVINMKTAKALGLTIPQSLLLRADEVIQ